MRRASNPSGDDERLYAELATLRDARKRRTFLSRQPRLRRAEVVARLSEIVLQKIRVDVREALALAEAAVLIARALRNPAALAQSLRAKGNALYALHDHKAAVEHHDRAVSLFEKVGKPKEVGRTLSTSIQPLILLGDYQRAQAAAERAREIFTREKDELRLARLDVNIGNIYHRQDRFAEALDCYERAYERLLPRKDVEGIAVALENMAVCLISLNDFARALEFHERARAFCEEHGMPTLVALADYNIAYLYYFRGQYGRAIESLKATREACRALGDVYLAALCPLDLAEIYLELNLSEDAAAMAEEALEAFRHLGMGYETARSLSFLAMAHGQQGRVLRALELFAEARALFVREQNTVWPALLDLYQAIVLFGAGRLFESRRACLAALESFRSSALAGKAMLCRLLLCRLALRMDYLETARQHCEELARSLSALHVPAVSLELNYVRGQIEQAAGRPEAAYQSYRAAQHALESFRFGLRGQDLKIGVFKNKLEVYEGLVELTLARDVGRAAEEAFSYVERAKSRSLQDLILRGAPPSPAASAGKSELVRRVNELREELNWYYHRIEAEQLAEDGPATGRVERLEREVQVHEAELLRVVRELPASEGEPLEVFAPVTLPLATIRAALPPEAMLVEYFCVGSRLLAFLVTRERLDVVPVSIVARVQHLLHLLHAQLAWARPNAGQAPPFSRESLLSAAQKHLAELYQELLAPLRPKLDAAHLIFVPHHVLHYVPFHALYDGRLHVIDSFSVSYAPSATIYALCQARAANSAGGSLILGASEPLTPFTLDEVRSVAARLPQPELYVNGEVSAKVLREKGESSRFVHVATQGSFRNDNPMFSGFRLGDSSLTLYDLFHLKLAAELVALSGSVAGPNVGGAGDELVGLARGLFCAGAASLLFALWEVPDRSTAEFMSAFYDHYSTTRNRAAAVRDAIRAVRARYPHPVNWAAFCLSGKVFAN